MPTQSLRPAARLRGAGSAPESVPVRLERERELMQAGGSVAYRVLVDVRWVGWVGDGREWRGWRYGARRWWACWRQDGDTAARWGTDLDFTTRNAARDALIERVTAATTAVGAVDAAAGPMGPEAA